ncbi:filamentous hemagglutinin family protein [Pseudomonas sp. SWRI92]|uniref:filamentous haemagglutinin family protein n=1 Tax=Pseudomonas sp. SWRI92 TaxID=2745499 RepID=UPI0016461063|nr:filamentous haemagglutinin family protein [Pseudomonas sp. SWRI92]MBC3375857.1 filamentous hemagglutinin family protein [Pseudomonas sp. SWRI92]
MRRRPQKATRRNAESTAVLRLKPLAQAIALLLLANPAYAATSFSSAWFAAKGAAPAAGPASPSAPRPGTPPPLAQQQRVQQQLGRSLANMNSTVAAIAASQAAQAAGRAATFGAPQTIHNGLGGNGLNAVIGPDGKPLFVNANGPVQSDANGKVVVTVKQTADKAILNWDTFNIGRDTTLAFQQDASWAALNKVNNSTAPSQIQGQIKADGTVMILNSNGVVFSGSSQVNVRNLVAAATDFSDEQFKTGGLYNASAASFTNAQGAIRVETGAQISTAAPSKSTAGGGYVLLLGKTVDNAGTISTQRGQTVLAAGDSFTIKKGFASDGNSTSTTRGNEVIAHQVGGTGAGQVSNTGLLMAASGDVTLTGNQVRQNGVAVASTSADTRGTLHLTARGSEANVTLGEGSTTAILLDASATALDSQRDSLLKPVVSQDGKVIPADTYRRDLSLVRIDSAGSVDFQKGSITLATGGQVAVNAGTRSLVRDGAVIDVSGATGVKVAMEANSIKVNIQGNEQRDAAGNRDEGALNNNDVWVDTRELVFVPAGTNGYATDRWYTAGGLLEVSGYLGTQGHSAAEWMAQGGTVSFTGNDLVTQAGSQINMSGGTLDVQSGTIKQTWLRGADGRLYELNRAPGDRLYTGLYKGYEDHTQRWGQTNYYYNPLIAPRSRQEAGYTVGRDAGTLVIGTRNAVLEGTLASDTFQGDRQTRAAQAGLDGYQQSQKAVARGGQLVVGAYVPFYVKESGTVEYALGATADTLKNVVIGKGAAGVANGIDLGSALPTDRQGTLYLDSNQLSGFKLGAIKVAASEGINVEGALQVAPAGTISLFGPKVAVNADITAHGGVIQVGRDFVQVDGSMPVAGASSITVGKGVRLDASGLWSNLQLDPADISALPYQNGGSIALKTGGALVLGAGSVLDVSSGAALLNSGKLQGGKGGDVSLSTVTGELSLGGELRGQGVKGGGTLQLHAGKVLISDTATSAAAGTLLLDGGFFKKGFSAYDIIGSDGLEVAEGTRVDVTLPVYRQGPAAAGLATGGAPGSALETWTPPLYLEDAGKGVLTQRQGASLALQAGSQNTRPGNVASADLLVGKSAVLNVDPGQAIRLSGIGQITVDGTLNAWGGSITVGSALGPQAAAIPHSDQFKSIWIGENAVLDVAARAATATDARGNQYGFVRNGGSIVIGGEIDHATGDGGGIVKFIVVREGALLDASGASAVLDDAGQNRLVASHGGSISFGSTNGLYLDGQFKAAAGGTGAAGGSLSVGLGATVYSNNSDLPDDQRKTRELIIEQHHSATGIAAGSAPEQGAALLEHGYARLAVDQVEAGGFDTLSLFSTGLLTFDGNVNLSMANALQLYAGAYGMAETAAADSVVNLRGSYVRLAGAVDKTAAGADNSSTGIGLTPSARPAAGKLLLTATGLLEVRDAVRVGGSGTLTMADGEVRQVDRRGFADLQLNSQGDIRMASSQTDHKMLIRTPGVLGLTAAQIYPGTGVQGTLTAKRIDIGRNGSAIPSVPYSAFGELRLEADVINQGGILRAPLGNLIIGQTALETASRPGSDVNFLPGSLTSVSGAGLVMPYGGTADGKSYVFDGVTLDKSLLQPALNGVPGKIDLVGETIDVAAGAVVDVSGGGELTGAGFISGRGGSTDARFNPLVQFGPDGFLLPALSSNPVYAIVPGVQTGYAPVGGEAGAVAPVVGQQITLGAGVPGLPAGTYTLLPSTFALLPGAFRIEVNGLAGQGGVVPTQAMRNGSWATAGTLGIAGTGVRDSLASQVIVTAADTLRRYSQYNETSFSQFALADAARLGVPAVLLPRDAKAFNVTFERNQSDQPSFSFAGKLLSKAAKEGRGSTTTLTLVRAGNLEIIKAGEAASSGSDVVTLTDDAVNAIGASSLFIGGYALARYGQGGNFLEFGNGNGSVAKTQNITLRSGATLRAPEVFLVTSSPKGGITVEQGASINTLGMGAVARDSHDGYIYSPGRNSVLAVSNGYLNMLAPSAPNPQEPDSAPGSIRIGVCDGVCTGTTRLYSEGTIASATDNRFELTDAVRFGTRNLTLAVGGINVGNADTLADLASRNLLPNGLTLNQQVLDRLLLGDTSAGAPALETLVLGARDSLNFYGNASLDTFDAATGKSRLKELVLTTPAIYGKGEAGETARIRTRDLIWNGAQNEAASIVRDSAGTGAGNLQIDAERIGFGYAPTTEPKVVKAYDRLALGFANVNLNASERITANHKGGLLVYQRQGEYITGKGFQYSGGNLNILTPLMTGEAGSVNRITAGGNIRVSAPAGSRLPVASADSLGAELALNGKNVRVEGNVVLPSGKLTLSAEDELTLTAAARLDLAGRKITFNDVSKYSWGGDLILESRNGNIRQAAGSVIDLSAVNNQAGTLKATALAAAAGKVDLAGSVLGSSSGYYDAGGTAVPYKAGSVDIRAQRLGDGSLSDDFATLNQRLNQGQVFGGRLFQLKQGDLVIGDGLKAGVVSVSVDGGKLTVNGTVDASGERVGSIRLAGKQGLTLGGNAVLDAHGRVLRVDSYGQIIDSPNRAMVELSSGDGLLTLAGGARIDLRHGTATTVGHDGKARGTLELNAPRLGGATAGDIAIDASGNLNIQGAKLIALNGVQRYDDADYGTDPAASGRPYQVINQDYLNGIHDDNRDFIDNALNNNALRYGKLAGLNNAAYRNAFHLRPGVEIVSATADGDLVVQGDLDLSGYRYASLNPLTPKTAVYGSGEVGSLVLRAGGDLSVYGSINDGFAPPPATPDDDGWVLTPGKQLFNGDVIVPRAGIELQEGTTFLSGVTLNYDLPLQTVTLAAGTRLPVPGEVAEAVNLPAGTVLAANIRNADGSLAHAAGTRLSADLTLDPGMILDAGSVLAGDMALTGLVWPKGVALPSRPLNMVDMSNPNVMVQAGALQLALGALIPAGTDVKLADGVEKINLRGGDGKGRNWAIAPMLAEGSQSWSVRTVAGADVQAADTRLADPYAQNGKLTVADTHYAMQGTRVQTGGGAPVPGSASDPVVTTTDFSMMFFGDLSYAGLPAAAMAVQFGMTLEDLCAIGPMCTNSPLFITVVGAGALGNPAYEGRSASELAAELGQTVDMLCVSSDACLAKFSEGEYQYAYKPEASSFSVLRTGTGDLDLVSAGDLSLHSLFGIYTAGTSTLTQAQSAGYNLARGVWKDGSVDQVTDQVLPWGAGVYESLVDGGPSSLYRAWYPDQGGNLSLTVGADLTGDVISRTGLNASSSVGNWLWRQGGGVDGTTPTAWWINFGTFVAEDQNMALVGFTGLGTLGGGNLAVDVAGDAGMLAPRGDTGEQYATRSQGLVLAVGSTGRMVNGQLQMTGGGDLSLRVGGGLNPSLSARALESANSKGPVAQRHALNGSLINLRGTVRAHAGSFGGIELVSGPHALWQDPRETRAYDPFQATSASATGGMIVVPGDATVALDARGDLVLGGAADAGRLLSQGTQLVNLGAAGKGTGSSWFSLWTDHTAIDLLTAGGNLTPFTRVGEVAIGGSAPAPGDSAPTDGRFVYPSILRATAANGSLYYGPSGTWTGGTAMPNLPYSLVLAPGAQAQLEFLASDSIYAGGFTISPTNAPQASLATVARPGFSYMDSTGVKTDTNGTGTLFAFGGSGTEGSYRGADQPTRFYAVNGDIVGLRTGEILSFSVQPYEGDIWYEAARPAWIMAGRDIVNSGQLTNNSVPQLPGDAKSTGNLFVHDDPTDISVVSAGRDILYSTFNVAGPGTLEISAGRNILMEDQAAVTSLGPVKSGDNRPGASIVMQAGVGAAGPDYLGFVRQYLDPANLADAAVGLAQQPGKVAKTYEVELAAWLASRYGFSGEADQAQAYFAALPAEQQRVFAREVYFAELRAGGREYNNASSPRSGSYLRGRNAIAALFPTHDVAGNPLAYQGDITMFGGAGVHTNFGGDIQMLTPGGQQVFGIEGEAPPSSAGVITQGVGDIQLFSNGSVLLGQSRIMTTFGGDILAWSATGDINAGRGSKTTLVYTPPKRVYDNWGNVTLSPSVPSTGAGIATLNPIAEVAPGDIDLLAPLGTIDAGEAGIRVSGNINIAALHVVNAANIQVQGKSNGVPVSAVVNTGALTNASSAAASASDAAEGVAREQQAASRNRMPSVFSVQVLGFGNERLAPSQEGASRAPDHEPNNSVRVLGAGRLDDQARNQLTPEEQRNLTL